MNFPICFKQFLCKGAVIIYDRDRGGRDMGGSLEKITVSKEGFRKSFWF